MDNNEILKKVVKQYRVLTDFQREEKSSKPYEQPKIKKFDIDTVCFCNNERTVTKHSAYCSKCKIGSSNKNLISNTYSYYYVVKSITRNVIVVCTENDDSIVIRNISVVVKESKKGLQETISERNRLVITPGKGSKSYKVSRGKETEVPLADSFEWLKINSQTLKNQGKPVIIYEGANNLIEFLRNSERVINRTAFWDIFANSDILLDKEMFFLLYMYVYSSHPVVELLVKMGFYKLISELLTSLQTKCNKQIIKESISDMKRFFNETTKGSSALKIPSYVSKYLNELNADARAYEFFTDLYELEPFSKDVFNYIIENNFFSNMGFSSFSWSYHGKAQNFLNILKYDGFTIKKIVSHYYHSDLYVKNNPLLDSPSSFEAYLMNLADLLKMCEFLNVSYLPLPTNIKEVHDKTAERFKDYKEKKHEEMLAFVSEKYAEFIPDDENYTIVIPKSSAEFIDEGMQQHNCVASYVRHVVNGECLVFFIREKEFPDKSFVTAECRNGEIMQILLRNNRSLTPAHNDVLQFAKKFIKNIKTYL